MTFVQKKGTIFTDAVARDPVAALGAKNLSIAKVAKRWIEGNKKHGFWDSNARARALNIEFQATIKKHFPKNY